MSKTKEEKQHMDKVAQLGCIACAILGYHDSPAELHHIKDKTGMGKRSSHFEVIPLCYIHHRGMYGYHNSPAEFTGTFGKQRDLLQMVLDYLDYRDGKKGSIEPTNPFSRANIIRE